MNFNPDVLTKREQMTFALRALYLSRGYIRYCMSKFEEYDLYSRNKDFLVSDSVITFTDTNGKLMALKPDVTLSIIKNSKDLPDRTMKVCYDENVYRVSKSTNSFREIMQSGIECIGNVNAECIGEALSLAGGSLALTGENYIIEVSHLGMISYLLDGITTDGEVRAKIIKCIGEKNIHGIKTVCTGAGINPDRAEPLIKVLSVYGTPEKVLPSLKEFEGYEELKSVIDAIDEDQKDKIIIDFSVVGDMNYYNGIIFKGFVEGVPGSVLSGGQYDKLMRKLGRKSRAVGFAVYTDMLERLGE